MRISFQRSGGFAGINMVKVFDSATLSENEISQLRRLVEAADFFRLPKNITAKTPQPDRFQYLLTVEDNKKKHTVTVGEQSMPGTMRPLIEWLMVASRRES
ncbi:MAG TPA: hypothetical protein DEG17_04765 [Cyanobacteria bacterium UBA11149]|nr:hypothetical protein [Cyanobacteria bacterium UBA11366]HBK66787.1 hypothetical protein [Cyanobacteria bacterium UBA11166]HBR72696.1 hypothetical protein [Cyanobacteria bacterium UBA11159]HBS71233.1 hypothetical protein [Cyanobacteria bacterium UBA11153]HBW88200.1 hypothetical protein [Cyanobacteria bacterium UBA11149]HCA96981.1 hypothetical protein [Cyanobacteria bacterium UBA9226]